MIFNEVGSGMGGVKIASGSYVGTGTYGVNNPTRITFDFTPKFVCVHAGGGMWIVMLNGITSVSTPGSSSVVNCVVGWGEKAVAFYNTSDAGYQYNQLSKTYLWFAIG